MTPPSPLALVLSAVARARVRLGLIAPLVDRGELAAAQQELDRARALLFSAAGVLADARGRDQIVKESAARILNTILADHRDGT